MSERVKQWIAQDPDPSTRGVLQEMLDRDDPALDELFSTRLAFGTAGLRAELGPGPNRMNRLVVRQTTAGLMDWLGADATVVIGYDARYGSEDFAKDAARVVAACGGRAELLPGPLPTPVLAHAVLARNATAGIMVTASHNPPQDNGYKLYLSDGIQLVSPADSEIAAAIDQAATRPVRVADPADPAIHVLDDAIVDAHLEAATSVLKGTARDLTIVYTAMHGVGGEHLCRAFERAGFPAPHRVAEQFAPDPDFPTVAFPNPEEPGALDLSLKLAAEVSADLIIANDPDADRLALAAPKADGTWCQLSGDEVGILLADYLLTRSSGAERIVASSIVSSQMLAAVAAHHGIEAVTTLTGFKWVARPTVSAPGKTFVLGYEEALGYCVGARVRDKDGISAALVAAEMVAELKADGRTVWDELVRLNSLVGIFRTGPISLRFEDTGRRTALMAKVLAEPPTEVAGARLDSIENLSDGLHLPPTTGAILRYDDQTRIIVRPSGTEPKLKAYIEVFEPAPVDAADDPDLAQNANMAAAQIRATTRLQQVQEDFGRYLRA